MAQNSSPFKNDFYFNKNSLPIIILNQSIEVVDVNTKALNLFNYAKKEVIGKNILTFLKVDCSHLIEIDKINLLFKGELDSFNSKKTIVNNKGHEFEGELCNSLIINPENGERFLYCIFFLDKKTNAKSVLNPNTRYFDTILNKSPLIHYISNVETNTIVYENRNLLTYLGYTEKDYGGKTKIEFLHSLLDNHCTNIFKTAKDRLYNIKYAKTYTELKYYILNKKGEIVWIHLKALPIKFDKNQKIIETYGMMEDITNRKNDKAKIIEQQNILEKISSLMPEYTYLLDIKNNKFVFSNKKCKKVLGYSEKEFISIDLKDIIHNDFREIHFLKFDDKNNAKKIKNQVFETLLKHKSKGFRWYKHRIIIFERDENDDVKIILKSFEDIHEKKLKELKEIEQDIYIKTVATKLPSTVYIYNRITKEIAYSNNKKGKNILGYTNTEFLELATEIYHPDQKEEIYKKSFLLKKKNSTTIECLLKHKTKGYRWYRIRTKVLKRDSENQHVQLIEIIDDINLRKIESLKVAEQKKLLRSVTESVSPFIYLYNFNSKEYSFTNFESRKIFGYTKKEFIDIRHKVLLNEHYISLNKFKNTLLTKKYKDKFEDDVLLKHPKKGYIWVKIKLSVFSKYKDGSPKEILHILEDINESKLKTLKIEEQKQFITDVTDSLPHFLSVWDYKAEKCLYTNFENKTVFGYSKNEYVNNGFTNIHPDYEDMVWNFPNKMTQYLNKNEFSCEFLFLHKTKGYRWVELKIIVTIRDENELPIQFMEVIRDINDIKKSISFIEKQQDFIEKVNSTIPSIIQVSSLKDQSILYSNFEDRVFLGYSKKEWDKTGFELVLPRHYLKYKIKFKKLLFTKNPKTVISEMLFKTKEGVWKWVLVISKPFIFDEKGFPTQIISIFRDIDERKQLYLKLENQLTKNIELERFASIAAHDLKEPLRTMRNYAQILKATNSDSIDDDGKVLISHIITSTKRMSGLVQDILAFSRIDTENQKYQNVDLNSELAILKKDLFGLISENSTILKISELPKIHASHNQIRQVFQNLISNAIKFSKPNDSKISVSAILENNKWKFSVKDNGIGIPKNELDNIFGIFKKLHNRDEYEGQGIGLSICKRIIERHKGEIWVESEIGKGTTFYFTIPNKEVE